MLMVYLSLIVVLGLPFYILVQQGAPVHDEQSVGIILRAGNPLELSGSDKFACEDIAPALYALPSIVGELHFSSVKPDAVAEDGENGTRSEDIGIESFFLECIVLCQPCFVNQIHGFFDGVADILVIRGQREKQVVDFLYNVV